MYFGYIGPFSILFILNSLIIFKATKFQRSQKVAVASNKKSIRRKAEMTRTVYSITIIYIITTLPSAIIGGYYYGYIITLATGQLIINIVNAIQSIYQSFNFLILYFSNKLFAAEVNQMLLRVNQSLGSWATKTNIGKTNNTKDSSSYSQKLKNNQSTIQNGIRQSAIDNDIQEVY